MIAQTEDPSQVRYTSKTTPWLLDELFVLVTGQKAGWYAGNKTRSARFSLLDRVDRVETRLTHLENTCAVPPNPTVAKAAVPLPPLVSMLGFKDYFITASELDGTSSDSDNGKVSTADSTPVDFSGTSAVSKTTKATSISLGGTPQSPKTQPKSNLGGHKRPANVIDSSPTPAPRPIKRVKIVEEPKAVFEPWHDTTIESDSEESDNDKPSRATKTTSAKKPKKAAENKDVEMPDAAPSPTKTPSKRPSPKKAASKPTTPSPSKVQKTPGAPKKKKPTATEVKPVKPFQVKKKKPASGTPTVSESGGDEIVVASPSLAASKKAAAKDKEAAAASPAGRVTRSKRNVADQDAVAAAEAAAAEAVAKVLGGSAKAKAKSKGKGKK